MLGSHKYQGLSHNKKIKKKKKISAPSRDGGWTDLLAPFFFISRNNLLKKDCYMYNEHKEAKEWIMYKNKI